MADPDNLLSDRITFIAVHAIGIEKVGVGKIAAIFVQSAP